MSNQIPVSNDRSRMYWTPTMECYFIDLMIEQMQRGNRIGHTFNKQAWTNMLAVFNLKFGSQYDKDVLKSRYTNLWRQFNDVKNLLGQSGFTWDETREMVVADDYVWNAYLKIHPDATKSVLNFNNLCFIYGYTTADGRYSRSSHDLDIDDEIQAANIRDMMGCFALSNNECSRTEWSASMDQYFVELMLDQIVKGNKTDNAFNKQAWTEMLSSFNVKFGPQHGKRVLRHRYKKLSKYCCDMKVLLKQNGFSWDEHEHMIVADSDVWDSYIKEKERETKLLRVVIVHERIGHRQWIVILSTCYQISNLLNHGGFVWDGIRKMVIADDSVWEAYIQEQPDAIYFRNRVLENYVNLCLIQRNEVSNIGNNQNLQLQTENYPQEIGVDDGLFGDVHLQVEDIQILDQPEKKRPTTPSDNEPSSKFQRLGNEMQKAPSQTARTSLLSNKESKNNSITIESATSALQGIPEIDDDLLFDACDLLEDDKKAKTFLALDSNLRKKLLLRKLRL